MYSDEVTMSEVLRPMVLIPFRKSMNAQLPHCPLLSVKGELDSRLRRLWQILVRSSDSTALYIRVKQAEPLLKSLIDAITPICSYWS